MLPEGLAHLRIVIVSQHTVAALGIDLCIEAGTGTEIEDRRARRENPRYQGLKRRADQAIGPVSQNCPRVDLARKLHMRAVQSSSSRSATAASVGCCPRRSSKARTPESCLTKIFQLGSWAG